LVSGDPPYLFFRGSDEAYFSAIQLNPDGLSTAAPSPTKIKIENNSGGVHTSYHFKHGNKDYLLFSSQFRKLKVARSSQGPLGPYVANDIPLISGDAWDPTIVENMENEILIYGSTSAPHNVFAAGLAWRSGWPIALDFKKEGNTTRTIKQVLVDGVPVLQVEDEY